MTNARPPQGHSEYCGLCDDEVRIRVPVPKAPLRKGPIPPVRGKCHEVTKGVGLVSSASETEGSSVKDLRRQSFVLLLVCPLSLRRSFVAPPPFTKGRL